MPPARRCLPPPAAVSGQSDGYAGSAVLRQLRHRYSAMNTQQSVLALAATALGAEAVRRCFASAQESVAPRQQQSKHVQGRAAHWVIRCSDLKPFLRFASECFGMK